MGCNDARTLREVVAELDGMSGRGVLDVWKLTRVKVVHRVCVSATEPFRPETACEHECRSRWAVRTGIERDLLSFGQFRDRLGVAMILLFLAGRRTTVASIPEQNSTLRPLNKIFEVTCDVMEYMPDGF